MRKANHPFPGVEYSAGQGADYYLGMPKALVDAGLLKAVQIPGTPGLPKTSASFVNGVLQPKTARPVHDEHWSQASLVGRKLRLSIGISKAEKDRRAALHEAEVAAMPKPDIDAASAVQALQSRSAMFEVGATVYASGYLGMVVESYGLHRVNSEDGEFLNPTTKARYDWRYGYVCRLRSGEQFFYAAHKVSAARGTTGHLRVVSSRVARPEQHLAAGAHQ